MKEITLEELLEAGCHFGHQVTRQNPKARDFVFEARDNIHIIDLAKTKEGLEEAAAELKRIAQRGGNIIIVATKRQARGIVMDEINRAVGEMKDLPKPREYDEAKALTESSVYGVYYVTNRWIGGTLTNFSEVSRNAKKLKDIIARLNNEEEKAGYTKKEIGGWQKEQQKLESFYKGTADMAALPDALVIIDTHLEDLAVREARNIGMKTIGIVDTNADPLVIDYPIPANDDATGSIRIITAYLMDAWVEGRKAMGKEEADAAEKAKEPKREVKAETEEAKPKKEKKAKKVKEEPKTESVSAAVVGEPVETPKKRGRKKKTE